jgi:hypothetical protein
MRLFCNNSDYIIIQLVLLAFVQILSIGINGVNVVADVQNIRTPTRTAFLPYRQYLEQGLTTNHTTNNNIE